MFNQQLNINQLDSINYLSIVYLEQLGILAPSERQINLMEKILKQSESKGGRRKRAPYVSAEKCFHRRNRA